MAKQTNEKIPASAGMTAKQTSMTADATLSDSDDSLSLRPPSRNPHSNGFRIKSGMTVPAAPAKHLRLQRLLSVIEPLMLIIAPAVLIFCAVNKIENPVFLTTFVAIVSFVPFVLRFELKKPKPADIMPIAVLSAAAIVGRIAFVAIPNVQPVSAIVIFTGIWFGRQSGYLTGAFTALVSNMALGQGMWTPWQMYAWGLMGYLAGALFERAADAGFQKKAQRICVYIFGGLSAALFSIIMDVWFIIGFLTDLSAKAMLAAFGAGLSLNSLHIIATVIFLMLMLKPWGKKIRRIKLKYNKVSPFP